MEGGKKKQNDLWEPWGEVGRMISFVVLTR